MSKQSNYVKQSFFRNCIAKNDAIHKRRKEIARMKSGEILPDPQVVENKDYSNYDKGEVVPDLEVVEE